MQTVQGNLFTRNDTLLGVCEALGEDFGINPLWLRIGFAVPLIWNPVAVFAAYLAAGVVVLATRLIFPSPHVAAMEQGEPEQGVRHHEDAPELALAA